MAMKKYIAKSIGDLLYAELQQKTLKGRIYSVLPTEIKIESDGMLYTIRKPKNGNDPHILMMPVNVEDMHQWGLSQNDSFEANKDDIILNNLVQISLKDVQVWSSQWSTIPNPKDMFKLLPQIKALVLKEGNLKGLGLLLMGEACLKVKNDQDVSYNQKIILEQALSLLHKMRIGLHNNSELFWNGVLELVGLGSGITPSGDAFLIGLLLTLRYLEFSKLFQLPKLDINIFSEQVKLNTNFSSAISVIQAARGKPFELASDVIQNFFGCKRRSTTLSTLRLIGKGNISATDILSGIIIASEEVCKIIPAL